MSTNALVALTLSSILVVAGGSVYAGMHFAAMISCPARVSSGNAEMLKFTTSTPVPMTGQKGF